MVHDPSLALLTDLYQLTMAFGYWSGKRHDRGSVFHLYYRNNPFDGGYAIACGLEPALETLADFRFSSEDIEYLRSLRGNDKQPLFSNGFLDYLKTLQLSINVDAIAEGTVVFPNEPLLRVSGPILQCQILETFLLNAINFPTLIATKAARICHAAQGDPVLEFGLRRSQGIDGGLTASRSSYIGGCVATSNVLAGKRFGIPDKGTHAHSWIMSFEKERDAFAEYARAMPNNCIFLVDTYDTIEGIRNALDVADDLRRSGHEMIGIRLDSGDLVSLSVQARQMFDSAGYPHAVIVASNDLDEYEISRLKEAGAKIDTWGVGTKLVTAFEQPALGGVYKLSKMQDECGAWHNRIKLSQQSIKVSNPGTQQVRRYFSCGKAIADVIFDVDFGILSRPRAINPCEPDGDIEIDQFDESVDLLKPVMRDGVRCSESQSIHTIRNRAAEQLNCFEDSIRALRNPSDFDVRLERQLFDEKMRLMNFYRKQRDDI